MKIGFKLFCQGRARNLFFTKRFCRQGKKTFVNIEKMQFNKSLSCPTNVSLRLPDWLFGEINWQRPLLQPAAQMALAIHLSELNVKHGGGPFAAIVFDHEGWPVSAGVNQVITQKCSMAHAEIMALIFAQNRLQRFRLGTDKEGYTLVSSAQPCAMCFGAVLWSGLDRLIFGARQEDVERLAGFDEGPLPANWQAELAKRKIETVDDVLRDAACAVLKHYKDQGGINY